MGSPLLKAIVLGLLIGLLGLSISPVPFVLDLEENAGLGLLFLLRGAVPAPSDAVVVSIDKASAEQLNLPDNPDKWPRSLHARLTENLAKQGASVIAFDIHFIEPRSTTDDTLFAEAMRRADRVVLTEPLKVKEISLPEGERTEAVGHSIIKVVRPIELFSRAAVASAPFPLPRIPFKVNQYWTFETAAGDDPTVPLVVLQLYAMGVYGDFINLLEQVSPSQAGRLPHDAVAALQTESLTDLMKKIREVFERDPQLAQRMTQALERPDAQPREEKKRRLITALINMYGGGSSRYLNYYGPPGTITNIPYYQALTLGQSGGNGDQRINLAGKVVFVGLSEVLLAERKDSFYTVFSQANGTFISGVEIAATAFSNLMTNDPVHHGGLSATILLLLLWGLCLGVICYLTPIGISISSVVGLSVLYLLGSEYLFKTDHQWYPMVVPLGVQAPIAFVGAVVWNYLETNKERKNIRKAFEHYLPKDVVAQLAKDLAHIKTGNRVVYGVCLFTDAQNYTTLSETLAPQELGRIMNRYYETMFTPVKRYDGVVSGIIGDAMLALWVAASSEQGIRKNACLAALDINRQLQSLNQATDGVQLHTRIGLHCGQILLGHIGALDHYEYTPMGDIVNTASRIEGLNKYLGTMVLVSDEVMQQVDGILTRDLGRFRLKGKLQPIGVHELLCRDEEADQMQKDVCALFTRAMEAFRRRSWDEAIEAFQRVIQARGEDGPSHFYIEHCEEYKVSAPDDTWTGAVPLDKK